MANHKRGRAKVRRAGCLFCKPWKGNHSGKKYGEMKFNQYRKIGAPDA